MKDLLYLKDEQIKEFIQLLYYAYRETFSDPKEILSKKYFGPAHLRALNLIEGVASSFVIGNTPVGLVVPVIVSPTWNVPETIAISNSLGTA